MRCGSSRGLKPRCARNILSVGTRLSARRVPADLSTPLFRLCHYTEAHLLMARTCKLYCLYANHYVATHETPATSTILQCGMPSTTPHAFSLSPGSTRLSTGRNVQLSSSTNGMRLTTPCVCPSLTSYHTQLIATQFFREP